MKGKYPGIMPVKEFFQALYQDSDFFKKHGIHYIRNTSLYFTPCDEHGEPLTVRNSNGDVIDGFKSSGAYKCAADFYENTDLEAKELLTKPGFRITTPKKDP